MCHIIGQLFFLLGRKYVRISLVLLHDSFLKVYTKLINHCLQIKKLTLHASSLLAHLLLRLSSSLFIVLQMQLVVLANNTEWLALVILQVACVIVIHVDVGLHVIEVILRIVLGEMSTWVKISHRT